MGNRPEIWFLNIINRPKTLNKLVILNFVVFQTTFRYFLSRIFRFPFFDFWFWNTVSRTALVRRYFTVLDWVLVWVDWVLGGPRLCYVFLIAIKLSVNRLCSLGSRLGDPWMSVRWDWLCFTGALDKLMLTGTWQGLTGLDQTLKSARLVWGFIVIVWSSTAICLGLPVAWLIVMLTGVMGWCVLLGLTVL